MPYRRTRRTRNRRYRNRRIGRRRLLALSRRGRRTRPGRVYGPHNYITPKKTARRQSSLSPYRPSGGRMGSVYQNLFNKKRKRQSSNQRIIGNVAEYLGGGATALAGLGWLNHKLNSYKSRTFDKWTRLGDTIGAHSGIDPHTGHHYYQPPSDHVV